MLSLRPVWTTQLDSGERDRNRNTHVHIHTLGGGGGTEMAQPSLNSRCNPQYYHPNPSKEITIIQLNMWLISVIPELRRLSQLNYSKFQVNLGSIVSSGFCYHVRPIKKKKKYTKPKNKPVHVYNPLAGRSEVQGQLNGQFEGSLSYMRPCHRCAECRQPGITLGPEQHPRNTQPATGVMELHHSLNCSSDCTLWQRLIAR